MIPTSRINDAERYDGDEQCQYDCSDDAEFKITAEKGGKGVKFLACLSCLKRNGIHPIENGYVDGEETRGSA